MQSGGGYIRIKSDEKMTLVLTAHQPQYLPWLGFFHKLAVSDTFILLDAVQFEKNSFINRNKIKTQNGSIWLTVPVLIKGHLSSTITKTKINNNLNWHKKHWKAIQYSYQKAPFFDSYSEFFKKAYQMTWESLSDLDEYIIKYILKELGISINFVRMSNENYEGKKDDLILNICQNIGADIFVFGALGKDYITKEKFNQNNIKIYFQEYNHPKYEQLHGDFIPNLSVIDLLFNKGEESYEIIMKENIKKGDLINYSK